MSLKQNFLAFLSIILIFIAMVMLLSLVLGCTLSFQNVMTCGTATDVVDSDPKTDTQVDSQITVPIKGL